VYKARIYRSLPSELKVEISERELLALYNSSGRLIVVDIEGKLVALPRAGEIYDLPLISNCAQGEQDYFSAVNFLRAAKILSPPVFASIMEVGFSEPNDCLTALVGNNAKMVKIGNGSYAEKVMKLWILINRTEVPVDSICYADLRFPQKIYFSKDKM
jgi:hypothetical protein